MTSIAFLWKNLMFIFASSSSIKFREITGKSNRKHMWYRDYLLSRKIWICLSCVHTTSRRKDFFFLLRYGAGGEACSFQRLEEDSYYFPENPIWHDWQSLLAHWNTVNNKRNRASRWWCGSPVGLGWRPILKGVGHSQLDNKGNRKVDEIASISLYRRQLTIPVNF